MDSAAAGVNAAALAASLLSSQSWLLFCLLLGSSTRSISTSPSNLPTVPTQPVASPSPSAAVWWRRSPSCSVRCRLLKTNCHKLKIKIKERIWFVWLPRLGMLRRLPSPLI